MELLQLSTIADCCQAAVMPICLTAYIPQWLTLMRNRSSADVSLRAELLWLLGSCFGVFYAGTQVLINGSGVALLCSALLNLCCLLITSCLVVYYRRQPVREPSQSLEEAIASVNTAEHLISAISLVPSDQEKEQSSNEIQASLL